MRLFARVCSIALAGLLHACGGDDAGAASRTNDASMDAARDFADGGADAGDRDLDASRSEDAAQPELPRASRVCSADGFCWEQPTPQGETLHAAWAASRDDVWIVGDRGTVLRYDGVRFEAVAAKTTQRLRAVHGSSASDVWVAAEGGVVLHYDGAAWTEHDLGQLIDASGGAKTGHLYGIYAAAPDAVWAVGHSGVAAVIVHYDGERWVNQAATLALPEALHAVWGASPEHVWAVGDGGRILHFDGGQWQAATSSTGASLRSVHGLTEHDVWAVGTQGVAVHWDGTQWRTASSGLSGELHSVLVDVDTAPPDPDAGMPMPPEMRPAEIEDGGLPPAPEGPWRVWTFGADGRVFRWNGSVWAELPSGNDLALHGAERLAEGELLVVGELGHITRFEGDARQSLSAGSRRNHLALWSDGATLWSVGDELAHRDASGWSVLERPTERSLYAVWGDASGLWSVGTAGTIVRYEDGELRALEVEAAADRWLRGVWGAGESLWMVGHGGLALTRAAGSFIAVATPVRNHLLDVWGTADDAFWAVGEGGTVLRWNGMAWLAVPTGPMGGVVQNLRGVWGSAADDVWVVGTESAILHWNGERFEDHSRGAGYSLNDVWGRAPDDVYAVGTQGTVLHYDGDAWTELDSGTSGSLQSVAGDAAGRVFVAGLDGIVLLREP